jgi:O-antigen/teichoic acid export membrane protein
LAAPIGNRLARGMAVLFSTRALILGLQFVTFAIIASSLHPSKLGVYVFAVAVIGVFTIATDFGFQGAVAREVAQNPPREAVLLPNLLYLRMLLAVVSYLALLAFDDVVGYGSDVRRAVMVAGLALFITAFDGFQITSRVRLRMAPISIGNMIQAVLMLGGVIAVSEAGRGVDAYIAIDVATTAVSSAVITVSALREARFTWRPRLRLWPELAHNGAALGLANLAILLYYRLDILILGRIKSSQAVGQYGAGYRFVDAFNVIPTLVVTGLDPVFARSAVHSWAVFQRRYANAMHLVWIMAVPVGVVGSMTAYRILPRLPGFEQYHSAGAVLSILAPAAACILVSTVLSSVIASRTAHQRRLLYVALVVLAVNIVLNVALIPPYSYTGAAVATTVCEVLVTALSVWTVQRYVGVRWPLADVVRTLPAIVLMAAAVAATYPINPYLQAVIGLLVYLVCLAPTRALRPADISALIGRHDDIGNWRSLNWASLRPRRRSAEPPPAS